MSEFPPPPPPASTQPSRAGDVPIVDLGAATGDLGYPRVASRLTVAWRWLMAVAWIIVMAGIGAVAQSAFTVDSGPFWLSVKPLPFAGPVAVLIALAYNWRHTIAVSTIATVVTAAIAVADVSAGHTPVGIAEGVCAFAAMAVTVAGALSPAGGSDAA